MRRKALVPLLILVFVSLAAGCSGVKGSSPEPKAGGIMIASAKPTAPRNLKATPTHEVVSLSWEMSPWEDKYTFDIYRWQPGRQPMLLDSVPAGVHTYTDPSLTRDRYYFYAVVARNVGASLSDSSAQIDKVSLLPPPPEPVYDPLAGYLPPGAYYTDATRNSWIERRLDEIRDNLPYVFITEKCSNCDGVGIVALPTYTDGKPDLTYCPNCRGTGKVTIVYPKS